MRQVTARAISIALLSVLGTFGFATVSTRAEWSGWFSINRSQNDPTSHAPIVWPSQETTELGMGPGGKRVGGGPSNWHNSTRGGATYQYSYGGPTGNLIDGASAHADADCNLGGLYANASASVTVNSDSGQETGEAHTKNFGEASYQDRFVIHGMPVGTPAVIHLMVYARGSFYEQNFSLHGASGTGTASWKATLTVGNVIKSWDGTNGLGLMMIDLPAAYGDAINLLMELHAQAEANASGLGFSGTSIGWGVATETATFTWQGIQSVTDPITGASLPFTAISESGFNIGSRYSGNRPMSPGWLPSASGV